MRRALLSLYVLFLVGLSGFLSVQANQEGTYQGRSVPITQLGPNRSGPRGSFTNLSGIWDSRRVVIRDNEAWLEMWKRIHSPDPTHGPYSNLPRLPEIDFAREMLIVVALGARPTGSYGIIIDGAYEREKPARNSRAQYVSREGLFYHPGIYSAFGHRETGKDESSGSFPGK